MLQIALIFVIVVGLLILALFGGEAVLEAMVKHQEDRD